jgi:hypothetical protein
VVEPASIQGVVFAEGGNGFEIPAPGTLVVVERRDPPPGAEFIAARYTDLVGAFAFPDLVVGATYSLTAPLMDPTGHCPWRMYIRMPDGSRIDAPGGVTLPPGPPTIVDLARPQPCSPATPDCEPERIGPSVIAVGMSQLVDRTTPLVFAPQYGRRDEEIQGSLSSLVGACFQESSPWQALNRPVVVRMRRISLDPEPPAVEALLTNFGGGTGWMAIFSDTPLADGEAVRVEVDLAQAALAGLRLLPGGPATFTVNGSVLSWDVAYEPGMPLPMLEAGFHAVYPLDVHAFVENGAPGSGYGPGDEALCALPIRVTDLDRGTVQDGVTDHEGRVSFVLALGVYEVRVMTTYPSAGPWTARVVDAGGADPVEFAFTPESRPEIPSAEGPVHEVSVETEVYVGSATTVPVDVRLLAPSAWGDLEIDRVTTIVYGGLTKPVASFRARVLTLESVTIENGWARARVRLTAGGTKFPGESFGDKPLRLSVTLNRVLRTGLMVFRCENLQPGETAEGDFTKDTYWKIQPGVAVFDVVHLVGYDTWLRCKPM